MGRVVVDGYRGRWIDRQKKKSAGYQGRETWRTRIPLIREKCIVTPVVRTIRDLNVSMGVGRSSDGAHGAHKLRMTPIPCHFGPIPGR